MFENRDPKIEPTPQSVLFAVQEYKKIGEREFLKKYTRGRAPINSYLRYKGKLYPLSALWAASHLQPVKANSFNSNQAAYRFRDIGFEGAVKIDEDGNEESFFADNNKRNTAKTITDSIIDEYVLEGERLLREIKAIKRDPRIVAKAKAKFGSVCQVCNFNFGKVYGEIGRGFIEAHHIDPLHLRAGKNGPTAVDDFAMLCSNCHRMIHRTDSVLTIEQLKAVVAGNKSRST